MKNGIVVAAVVACLVVPMSARAQSCDPSTDPGCAGAVSAASSTLVLTIALPITTVGAVIYFVVSAVTPRPAVQQQTGKAAEMYLRQNALALQQNLATGSGAMIQDLASAMEIKREHLGQFGKLMQAHRGELAPLLDTGKLNPDRAVQFLKLMAGAVEHDAVLAPDYQGFLKHHAAAQG